jgi:hypothetical protein
LFYPQVTWRFVAGLGMSFLRFVLESLPSNVTLKSPVKVLRCGDKQGFFDFLFSGVFAAEQDELLQSA